jgi:hypothetical protein
MLTKHSWDLPDDVFGPGEVKPARPAKKVVKNTKPVAKPVRRSINDVDVGCPVFVHLCITDAV